MTSLTRYRFTLKGDQIVEDIVARSDADAWQVLGRLKPGVSADVVTVERAPDLPLPLEDRA